MKTLGITTFDKIKVGEVFAEFIRGNRVMIQLKTDDNGHVLLADDYSDYPHVAPNDDKVKLSWGAYLWKLSKLPISFQRNFVGYECKARDNQAETAMRRYKNKKDKIVSMKEMEGLMGF